MDENAVGDEERFNGPDGFEIGRDEDQGENVESGNLVDICIPLKSGLVDGRRMRVVERLTKAKIWQ